MSRMSVLLVIAVITFICLQPALAQQPYQLIMDANSVWIRAGESPILQYRYSGVPFKPYVKELYTPGGLNVLLDAPPDHQHHHGLMFAVGADGVNFWEETSAAGRHVHRDFTSTGFAAYYAGPNVRFPVARFKEQIYWEYPSESRLGFALSELREIEVSQRSTSGTDAPATVLAWKSELRVPKGKQGVALTGSHYFGLGLRFPRSMDALGEFVNADGKEGAVFRGEERLVQSNWCAYRATVDSRPVTVVMFGNPRNPRHPATWFTMAKPFAYMSATLRLHEEPLLMPSSRPLTLQYCVMLWDRHILPAHIDACYRDWVARQGYRLDPGPLPDADQPKEPK